MLQHGSTEVGSDFSVSGLVLRSPAILPRHCVFGFSEGCVTLTPLDANAEIEVNNTCINCSVMLQEGDAIRLGGIFEFVFRNNLVSLVVSLKRSSFNVTQSPHTLTAH
jgi:hypothetical protein